jgi:uncharacterized protein YndB with AHSA1/START domain
VKNKFKKMATKITVSTLVNAPLEKVWNCWTAPEHIIHWNFASNDWCAPSAENDLRIGGKFKSRMEAKDGSLGFDFEGVYTNVLENKCIEYILADDRKVKIEFITKVNQIEVIETFDPENENPVEMQQGGWQAILNNFKKYVEQID